MKKRVLSLLMALTLCLSLLPTAALAEVAGAGTDVVPVEQPAPEDPEQVGDPEQEQPENPEQIGDPEPEGEPEQVDDPEQTQTPDAPEGEQDTPETPDAPVENGDENGEESDPVQAAQALIDALPEDVTAENAKEIEQQLMALEAALEALTEEQLAQLDMTRYEALCEAMNNMTVEQENSTHTDHGLCTHGSECKICPAEAKNNAFTDAKVLTVKNDVLYIGGNAAERSGYSDNNYSDYYTLPDGNYYLGGNITIDVLLRINGTVNLCLNGYSITKTSSDKKPGFEGVITIETGKSFSLCNCKDSGTITHASSVYGRGVRGGGGGNANTTFNMFSGTISGNHSGKQGAGVEVQNGTFNMYGGTITDNHATSGGGVNMSGGSFTMYDGTISSNTAAKAGGGIYAIGIVTMQGGTITNNTAETNGGGVYHVGTTSTNALTISGSAKIEKNKAVDGGGVYDDGKVELKGGTITDNTATGNGGGVCYSNSSNSLSMFMTVSDTAQIEKNKAVSGGGIYVNAGTVKMEGGTIGENKATGNSSTGGGVYVAGTFNMSENAKITGNSAAYGGGVYVKDTVSGTPGGTFNMTGGSITGNTAQYGGGVRTGTSFTVSGNVNITDNKDENSAANNVYLLSDKTITITGALDGDASIGVSTGDIALGNYVKVATLASGVAYTTGSITPDAGGEYAIKAVNSEVRLYNGLHEHPVCGGTCGHTKDDGSFEHGEQTWTAVSDLSQIMAGTADSPKYYYLTQDVTLTSTWKPANNVVLCLNGYSITVANHYGAIQVSSGTFTLTDCNGSKGSKRFAENSTTGQWVPDDSGDITVTGGTITHESGKNGGAVQVNSGAVFTMYGGTLVGNNGTNGTVYANGGSFTMHGGAIKGNYLSAGGGVYVGSRGAFIMDGGVISHNATISSSDGKGGGVWTIQGTTFTMKGGEITDNTATYGGGVYVNGEFNLSGGTISRNTATGNGGGVYVNGTGKFTMTGGTIGGSTTADANTAGLGGGVCVTGGTFNMNGGKVAGNTANSMGGGVCVYDGKFTMTDGSITGNNAELYGGGVNVGNNDTYTSTSPAFDMTGGSITGNNVTGTNNDSNDQFGHGGGVYVNKNAKMIVLGTVKIQNNWKDGSLGSDGLYVKGDTGSANNLYLYSANDGKNQKTVGIGTGGLKQEARIGVSTHIAPTTGKQIQIATSAIEDREYTKIFIPDVSGKGYTIKKDGDALYLSAHEHSWTYSKKNDTTITASCTCGKSRDYTISTPTNLIYDGSAKTAEVRFEAGTEQVGFPTAPTVTYQVKKGESFEAFSGTPTDAGTYKASITMGEGENKATASVVYTIQQATPEYTVPTNLTTVYGKTLADVELPDDWAWVNSTQSVGNVGENTFKATYTPSNANYHAVSDIDVTVKVEKAPVTITVTGMPTGSITYGDTFTLTITQTGDVEASGVWSFTQDRHVQRDHEKSHPENGEFVFRTIGFCDWAGCSGEIAVTYESTTHKGSCTVKTPKINKKTLTENDLTLNGLPTDFTKVYDGSTSVTRVEAVIKSTAKVNAGDTLPTVTGTYAYDSKDVKDASKVTFTSARTESENYILPAGLVVEREATITPATITVTPNAGQSKTYGTADPELTYTATGAKNGETPVFTGALARAEGENAGEYVIDQGTLALKDGEGFKASNYTLKFSTNEVKFTINKADAPVLGDIAVSQKYVITTGTATVSGLMPANAGKLTYTPGSASTTGSVVVSDWSVNVETGEVTYTLSNGAANDTVTLPVTISSTNYKAATVNVKITLTNRAEQAALTITGADSVVYGETLTLSTTGGSGTGAVTWHVDKTNSIGGDATIDENGVLTPVKVGSVSVIATKAGDNDFNEVTSAPFVLMIKPATPTGEPGYTKITTSGKTLEDAGLTTGTLSPSAGTLEWIDDEGKKLEDTTVVEANKTYTWRFTPDNDNYTTRTGEIELYHRSSGYYYYPTDTGTGTKTSAGTGDAGLLPYAVTALMSYTGTAALLRRRKRED